MSATEVVIGGDICPVGNNLPLFATGDTAGIFGDLFTEFESADLSVANLECPLIEHETPIQKTGPALGVSSACIRGLAKSGINCLGLANNHILDHGAAGVENTLRVCADAGIRTFGAGVNLAEAERILVVNAGGVRIGLLGMAEHEWSIATESSAGANPLDLIRFMRNLHRHKGSYDFLIVLLHGGAEFYPFPSPRLRDVCRFLVEQGARVVVCQHSHCAGAHEAYGSGHIFYGQGNLIFNSPNQNGCWNEGFLIRLFIERDLSFTWKAIPHTQPASASGVRRMSPERVQIFLKKLTELSRAIEDESFIARSWEDFCHQRRHTFMSSFLGHGRFATRLNRNGRLVKILFSEDELRGMSNHVRCETHREALLTVLKQYWTNGDA